MSDTPRDRDSTAASTDAKRSPSAPQLPGRDSLPAPAAVSPADWPRGSGYAHGMVAEGRTVFVAGQIGWDPVTQHVVVGGLVAQVRQALMNIVAVLSAAGAERRHLVRLTWFVTDRDRFLRERDTIGAAYRDVIGRHYPAMSVLVVAGLLEERAEVEIEATAVVPVTKT